MKKISLFLLGLFMLIFPNLYSQDCDKLLQGSLYSFTGMTNTGSFSQDLRTYYLSDQFKSDMKSGKWGGSVTVPVNGVPVTLGMDFTEDKYSEFKNKILSITELSIASNFYQTSFSSIPNTNLYDAYVECVKIKDDVSKTGFIQGINVETEDIVVFTIYYRPQAPGDPMPIVQNFSVEPEGSIKNGALAIGQQLNSFSILVTCKRDQEKDMVLSLKTDRGSHVSKSSAEGSFSSSKELPLGTVITSFLNFEQFNLATKNNEKSPGGIWTSQKSKWSPCDGRPLPNSKYSKIASLPNAPDLRGVFLRGLNSFDPGFTLLPTDPTQLNPDPKSVGIYQPDELKSHNHGIAVTFPASQQARFTNGGGRGNGGTETTFSTGGTETRPKNVSIYYYVKIN